MMKNFVLPLLCLGPCATAATAPLFPSDSIASGFDYRHLIPGAYLVELGDDQDAESFFTGLGDAGFEFKRRLTMNSKVFKGVSFKIIDTPSPKEASMARIASRLKARNTWPLREMNGSGPDLLPSGMRLSSSSSLNVKRSLRSAVGYGPHVLTKIDKLHATGYTGKGKRIGIIDTGIDYNHPSLGGCFGKGCKVSYGWDIAGDNFTVGEDPVPDDDPYENINYHGTHVAGIIGAQNDKLGIIGAAPDAELGMFKVTGNYNLMSSEDILIAAMCMAFDEGSDVISMSWGAGKNWAQHPISIVGSRIVDQGVPLVVSASNSGLGGLWRTGGPSNGKRVISVGMTYSNDVPYLLLNGTWSQDGEEQKDFGWNNMLPAIESDITLPLFALDSMEPGSMACEELPENMKLSGKFILLQYMHDTRSCSLAGQLANLRDRGAEYVILFPPINRPVDDFYFNLPGPKGIAKVPWHYAAQWLEALDGGANVTVTIPGANASSAPHFLDVTPNKISAGAMHEWSSWGPTWEMDLKPDVSAPGANILSTLPLDVGGYGVATGTSMACPLVAGLVALLMNARGTSDPKELLGVLSSQAEPIDHYNYSHQAWSDSPAPVAQQGAGLVKGWKSSQVSTTLSRSSFSFNDTDNFVKRHTFKISNGGSKDVTYTLSHIGSLVMNTFNNLTMWPQNQPAEPLLGAAAIGFDSKEVIVAPGKSVEVTVTGSAPSNLDADLLPVYGGYIQVEGSNKDRLQLPYLGLVGSLHDTKTLPAGEESKSFLMSPGSAFKPAEANTTFTIEKPGSVDARPPSGSPRVQIISRLGTPILRADVIALDNNKNNLATTKFFEFDIVGSLLGYPMEWQGAALPLLAGGDDQFWEGQWPRFWGVTSDGTIVPEGRYQIVVSALRIFGDPDSREDWDFLETVPFRLAYT